MIRQVLVILIALLLCFGCATQQQPKTFFQAGTRIGIVNNLEPYLTHRHIGLIDIRSFTKEINVDWNIPAHLEAKLEDYLVKNRSFDVVTIKSAAIQTRLNQLAGDINAAAARSRVTSPNLVDFVESMASAYDLDIVIVVQSFEGASPWKIYDTPVSVRGYGLLTRQRMLGKIKRRLHWVHPYAQILVTIFSTQPVAIISSGRPRLRTKNVEDFNWPSDMANIPQTELDKLRPKIEAYADEAVINALQSANFGTAEQQ